MERGRPTIQRGGARRHAYLNAAKKAARAIRADEELQPVLADSRAGIPKRRAELADQDARTERAIGAKDTGKDVIVAQAIGPGQGR